VKDKWPSAYEAIKKFNISNEEMGEMLAKVDLEGKKTEEVVAEWMKNNEARWKGWIGQ
jgi:glycine betaine/proline transport system substrate-binding protein